MSSQRSIMTGPGRNSHLTIAFTNESPSTFRDLFFPLYPKGSKSVKTSIQTASGWATISPDPNRGMFAEHTTALGNRQGAWLRGPIPQRASTNDVRLALTVLGHRFWEVSTWRIWAYRGVASVLLGLIFYGLFSPAALLFAALPFVIRSPCTPRGLKMWVQKKGFVAAALQQEKVSPDAAENVLERMKAAAAGEA